MDSSNLQSTMSSDTADNSSMMVISKRDIFLSTYQRQNFAFPDSMMHYIAKNPKKSNVYQKMIKRCKYFFIKNPILVLRYLRYNQNEWKNGIGNCRKRIDMNKLSSKLWITDTLNVSPENVSNDSVASSIIQKIYRRDFSRLIFHDQVISLNEFKFLCSSVKDLDLNRVTVKNHDGTVVAFEKLVEQLPNAKDISYTFLTPSNNTSNKTFKELWEIPHLSNYVFFRLYKIPEDFDVESFYSFMKKNKKTRVYLSFSDAVSEEYKARLEAIIDEIIETKNHGYKPPYIYFPGLDQEKYSKLCHIY